MRKILLSAMLASTWLLAYSCATETADAPMDPGSCVLRAVISDGGAMTRTITVDNPGVRINTYWQSGDRIGVHDLEYRFTVIELKQER